MIRFVLVCCLIAGVSWSGTVREKPSDEAFVNSVFRTLVDSSFRTYNLLEDAPPCSFVQYDYEEWVKYGLRKDVPLYILDELAKAAHDSQGRRAWRAKDLPDATCVSEEKANVLLAADLPLGKKTVFTFSRPAFSEDGSFAAIDMGFRCDNRQCGMGATFIFQRKGAVWQVAGRKISWGNGPL